MHLVTQPVKFFETNIRENTVVLQRMKAYYKSLQIKIIKIIAYIKHNKEAGDKTIQYKNIGLKKEEENEIENILELLPNRLLKLKKIWFLINHVWDDLGCDNKRFDSDNLKKIQKFYNHPVWILNGLFLEQHELSMQHRYAISNWIVSQSNHFDFKIVVGF